MEARELFDICEELLTKQPTAWSARRLHELLSLTAAQGCSGVRGAFGNLFAQTDFLCKRLGISAADRLELQTARRHTSHYQDLDEAEWPYDVRAVALLISAVFRCAIPGSLRQLFPPTARPREKGLTINRRYVRCIVQHHDDSTIWADTEEGEIAVDYGNSDLGRDFGYLRKILRPAMQLNLLDCHVVGSTDADITTVTPGIIIVEPDFLIDISSLAACFTSYGHHPLLYTLNRLKPKANSQAMLLGNFAGVALDGIVNSEQAPETAPASLDETTDAALKRAFREEALRYWACPDFDPVKFKQEAQRQVQNIAEAVDILKGDVSARGGFLLEPSFVCEQLGLQGRVDLMAADMTLLVEQKSGKNMKIEYQSHDSHGLQLESHYVQLLLYYGILRYNFQRGDSQVDTRLLYSRYEASRGLLSVNYYRTLLREALKLRNQIVATDLLIAREGFGRIVPLLNADVIYKDVKLDGYFHRYVLPQLSALTMQVAALNTLERTYLERMMTSVYREQVAQKLGSGSQRLHHSGGAASDLWLMPLNEKLETGNIYLGLTIGETRRTDPDGGYDLITLNSDSAAVPSCSNFRRGDMIYLYQYDGEPDVRRSILYKGTLHAIGDGSLTVLLTDGQQNEAVFGNDHPWAVEHGNSDASTSGCIRSLFAFASADASRRALLLGQRAPRADLSLSLSTHYNDHYDDILLRIRQAQDYFLLVGPPGTGKTSMALRFMVHEELATVKDASLLLTAYTNRAVDEICAMLTDAGLDYLRIGSPSSCDPRFVSHLIEATVPAASPAGSSPVAATFPAGVPIIVATTSMLLARPSIFELKHFTLAIVDEASQILEPGLIGILASDCVDRFVLIGDHKQLPAVVQQDDSEATVDEECLRAIGLCDCRQSLFQRLYQWELSQGRTQFVGTLTRQGRMHPEVALFASEEFYDGQLLPVPIAHQTATSLGYDAPAEDYLDKLLKEHRVLFLPVPAVSATVPAASPAGLNANPAEAQLVADLLQRIHRFYGDRFDADKTVGVIVPYRNQIAAIRAATEKTGIDKLRDVSVDTVERYQGSQRDIIIYSFTVTRRYQLDFLTASTYEDNGRNVDRKLNVALTRAKKQMIMVGNPQVLRHNPLFRQLIEKYSFTTTD